MILLDYTIHLQDNFICFVECINSYLNCANILYVNFIFVFLRNNERFADLFNSVDFNGRQVINPDELTEMDTDVSVIIQFNDYNESYKKSAKQQLSQ